MVAGRQTVELATDNPFECFISLRNGLHTVFIVHLDAHVAVNTPFVLYLTDKIFSEDCSAMQNDCVFYNGQSQSDRKSTRLNSSH